MAGILCIGSYANAQAPITATLGQLQAQQSEQKAKLDELVKVNEALAKSVEDKTKALEQAAIFKSIDTDRKSIDFWFAALAVITTIVAALGAFLPFLLGRQEKELLKAQLQNARDLVTSINEQHDKAVNKVAKLEALTSFTSGSKNTDSKADAKEIAKEIQAVMGNPEKYDDIDKLRARAVQASKYEPATEEQALQAYELWKALAVINERDDSALFNAGYWAQALAEKRSDSDPLGAQKLLEQASTKYAQALAIKPDDHDAAYNWGNALNAQASALSSKDPEAAQALWSQACTKYAQALDIKPDKHGAANNWGIALNAQASALNSKDPQAAQALWAQASTKYAQALAIKPDDHEAAYNWGSALNAQASALNSQDPQAAQALWAQASTRYAQALVIKPGMHEAANNWGASLINQASALSSKNPEAALRLLTEALELLEKYAKSAPVMMAFNLACVNSCINKLDLALEQLEVCRAGKDLPDHWLAEDDLANLRETDAYKQWFAKHFP